ncbi:MAG: methyltransferase domain-containing protein [Spirochaetales bacterium]
MPTLIAPELERNRGTGHLKRSLTLLNALPDAFLYVPPSGRSRFEGFGAQVDRSRIVSEPGARRFETIVVDRFSVSREEIETFAALGMTVGIDLGGPGRECADYLIDTLPRLDKSAPNVYTPASGSSEARPTAERGRRLLVTFGGEDPARLTEKSIAALRRLDVDLEEVCVVRPRLRPLEEDLSPANVIDPVESLQPLLLDSGIVLTAFGLTAFEAVRAGARVITVAVTPYHAKLANPEILSASLGDDVRRSSEGSLPSLLEQLAQPPRRGCPAHGKFGRSVFRNVNKSYLVCPLCGMIYLERFTADTQHYDSSYFMDEYEAQYGRTYLEDVPSIYRMGQERLRLIRRLRPPTRRLLDVGCAYGPFLSAANDCGYEVTGLDVAPSAVGYVRETLGFPAVTGSILDPSIRRELEAPYGVVSLWYVVEHFWELDTLLSALSDLVLPGGVLALATPHGQGVSARRNTESFFAASPRDHFTIWTRNSAKRLLREYGFELEIARVTGHHPERYPAVISGAMPSGLARLHSKLFGWGDTFELYARRMTSKDGAQ